MAFHIYRCGYLSDERERNQMTHLLGYLEQEFAQRKEDCIIIIEPTIPLRLNGNSFSRKPDALIVKDGVFTLVDLKAFEGIITADCSLGGSWRNEKGEDLLSMGRENPFSQAHSARRALIRFLTERYVSRENAPGWAKREGALVERWVERNVKAWVVTWEGSIPKVTGFGSDNKPINERSHPYFRVLPVERVPGTLAFVRGEVPLLGSASLSRFLQDLGAKLTNRMDWSRGALVLGQDGFTGLNGRITDWMDSGNLTQAKKGLERIRELDLKHHLVHVLRCWEQGTSESIRMEALLILVEWQYDSLGKVLDQALNDRAESISGFAREFLTQNSYPETINTLVQKLKTGPPNERPTVMKALALSGSQVVGDEILSFAEREFSSRPFTEFQHWAERAHQLFRNRLNRNDSERQQFEMLERKRLALLEVLRATIDALGLLDYKASRLWMKDIVAHPTSLGFESDDLHKLEWRDSDYYSIFEHACKALGIVGRGDLSLTSILLDHLRNSPEDFQEIIIKAIGELGNQNAVRDLLRFVDSRDNPLCDVTVDALSKLKAPWSFDSLVRLYLVNPSDDQARWIGEALSEIDRGKFEALLLERIAPPSTRDEERESLLRALFPIASSASVDTLFSLLPNPRFSGIVPWTLSTFCKEGPNFERAMELTFSNNPIEAAGAIDILTDYYLTNLSELERFEGDVTPVEVRRSVTTLYLLGKSKERLTKYVKDPDSSVRYAVFVAFRDGNHDGGEYLLSGRSVSPQKCEVLVDKPGNNLVVQAKDEVLILPLQSVELACIVNRESTKGVYLKFSRTSGQEEVLLLTSCERFYAVCASIGTLESAMNLPPSVRVDSLPPSAAMEVQKLWLGLDQLAPERTA